MTTNKGFKISLFSIICIAAVLGAIGSFAYIFNGPYINTNYVKSVDGLIDSKEEFICSYDEITQYDYYLIPEQQRDKALSDYRSANNKKEKDNCIHEFLANLNWNKTTEFDDDIVFNITIYNSDYTFCASDRLEKCVIIYKDEFFTLKSFYGFSKENSHELGKLILELEK